MGFRNGSLFLIVITVYVFNISSMTTVQCFTTIQRFPLSKSIILKSSNKDTETSTPMSEVEDRLDLSSRFTRWKILQDILEEEETPTAQDINEILFLLLKSFLDNPRPLTFPNGDTNPSPTLSVKQRELLVNELFQYRKDHEEKRSIGFIKAIPTDDFGNDSNDYENEDIVKVYNLLEDLHPDREEDEDAFKGCWDLIMELYGKESTKISEQSGDKCWKVRSSVVRLLIHYDFLVDGLGESI